MVQEFQNEKTYIEWKELFKEGSNYYIYGAANSAKLIISFAEHTNVLKYIKGCVVTNGEENVDSLCGLPVYDIHLLRDEKATILLPHTGVYKREICELLDDLGFTRIVLIHKYFTSLMKEKVELPLDVHMEKVKKVKEEIKQNKSVQERICDEELRNKVSQIRKEKQPDFGEDMFYQSLEFIELEGKRPSLYRIEKYGLKKIIGNEMSVLDIGCNAGFIDITIAPLVKEIIGVEYDETMVEIANVVKEYIGAKNCQFYAADFNDWIKENNKTFDVVLAFAIHHWINIEPKDFVEILNQLLKENGYICIESHDLFAADEKFDEILILLCEMGYKEIESGRIKDDGVTERKYKVLKK